MEQDKYIGGKDMKYQKKKITRKQFKAFEFVKLRKTLGQIDR